MYTAYKIPSSSSVEQALQRAPRSPRFVDMVTGEPGIFDTRAAVVWDEQHLYVRFEIEEPFVEAKQTVRDSLVFLENDIELFIDGGDCYYELEVNALNTVYEVFFIWKDCYADFPNGEFDVHRRKAFTFAGDYDRAGATFWRGTHPRGARWAFLDFDLPGLQTSVKIDGYLNDRTRVSRGWQADLVLPWAGMKYLANGRSLPPRNADEWRFFFGRFEKLVVNDREVQPHPAWCWTAHGVYDTHMPERWTPVRFDTMAA